MTSYAMRWVVTHLDKYGARVLDHACQGRNTFDTREQAQEWIDAAMEHNGPEQMRALYGLPLEPRVVPCWPGNHDPVGIYAP